MRSELICDILHHLDSMLNGALKVGDCPGKFNDVIEQWEIPMSLKRLLQWKWFNVPLDAGFSIYSVEQIVESEDEPRFRAQQMMQIGSCINGDMICIDYSQEECPVYFTSHDTLWEEENTSARDCSVLIFDSLAELMLRIAESKYIPTDYYSGSEYRKTRNEMDDRSS